LTFGSLFAGIGGFDLGFERAGMVCKWQVEIEPYCRRVLAKHWPTVHRHDDVRTFPDGEPEAFKVDVICGGFPCQDVSLAGRRAGLKGERSGLWSEFARIIRVLRPPFVVVENVPGLLAPEKEEEQAAIGCVVGELAECGYDAEWACIPASAFGSTQQRFRVFIVAYPQGQRDGFRVLPERWREEGEGAGHPVGRADRLDPDAPVIGPPEEWFGWRAEQEITAASGGDCEPRIDADTDGVERGEGRQGRADPFCEVREATGEDHPDAERSVGGQGATEDGDEGGERRAPGEPDRRNSPFVGSGWWGAEPEVVRMVHGLPRGLVRDAIRGLGNSVVPQVAEWIGRRITEAARGEVA
jgi:DNA (cytosine-5)-methyltransferase 1